METAITAPTMQNAGGAPFGGAKVLVPSAETARAYRDALGKFATGVTIITTSTERGPIGVTANSFASVSLEPALVLWSLAKSSGRFGAFAAAKHYSIHVMRDCQESLALEFARNANLFDTGEWRFDENGVPFLNDTLARFDCEQEAIQDAGDHVIIVGRVAGVIANEGEPLIFAKGKFGRFRSSA